MLDNSASDDLYALTMDSVEARNSQIDRPDLIGHGLSPTYAAAPSIDRRPEAEPFAVWDPVGTGAQTGRFCFGQEPAHPSSAAADQVGRLITVPDSFAVGETKSVTYIYRVY